MSHWLFKVSDQAKYPDEPGVRYVYDNTHSIRLEAGDTFLYLDKTKRYSFTGTGIVKRIRSRPPTASEAARAPSVRVVNAAQLADVLWFTKPLSISTTTKVGMANRALLGIVDVNKLGWSQSMPRISMEMYDAILNTAAAEHLIQPAGSPSFRIPDGLPRSKTRPYVEAWAKAVHARADTTCAVCGSRQSEIIEAAHLSPWAADPDNRANPANGLSLCTLCHRALDRGLIAIRSDGELLVRPDVADPVAIHHFTRLSSADRKALIAGAHPKFLDTASLPYWTSLRDAVAPGRQDRNETRSPRGLRV